MKSTVPWYYRIWLATIADACHSVMREPTPHMSRQRVIITAREIAYDWAWLATVGIGLVRYLEGVGLHISPDEMLDWVMMQSWRVEAWRRLALQARRRKRG